VRLIHCNTDCDQDFNWRKEGYPPPHIASWMYARITLAPRRLPTGLAGQQVTTLSAHRNRAPTSRSLKRQS